MPIKSILVAASGGTASEGAVELACRLAKQFDAHLEGYHVRFDPREALVIASSGFGLPLAAPWMDEVTTKAEALANKMKATFETAAARHGLARTAWRDAVGNAAFLVSRRARFFDLAILGRSDRVLEEPYSDTVEETILQSGRPVLLAPSRAPAKMGERIAFGWNGSAQAVRALSTSLPLLAAAREVAIITVGNKEQEVSTLLDYLALHGIKAKHRSFPLISGVGPGDLLLSGAREEGADLLIMGGYGHAPLREFLFGGATREIVGVSLLPLLLSH
ncbi:MAG TPA: universal stress protein [Stellaceae bacterium]|nr:universal stress protein [Stellaceae bacterium]